MTETAKTNKNTSVLFKQCFTEMIHWLWFEFMQSSSRLCLKIFFKASHRLAQLACSSDEAYNRSIPRGQNVF